MNGSLFDPEEFILEPGVVPLASGGLSPMLKSHQVALLEFLKDKGLGMEGDRRFEMRVEAARRQAAVVFGTRTEEIAFVSNVAEGMSMVAESIAWRPGDNVVVEEHDFASVAMPFVMNSERIEVRVAQGTDEDRIVKLIDDRTRVVALAQVSYVTGELHDVLPIRTAADKAGAILALDLTQNAGALRVDATIADFAFSSCYKFLLGASGTAIAYWNMARQPDWEPATAGWYSVEPTATSDYTRRARFRSDARRFSRGNLSHPSVYVLDNALRYLASYGAAGIEAHIRELTARFTTGVVDLGIPLLSPAEDARRGPNVCVPSARAAELQGALEGHGIRTWNGVGRVRFSFHGFIGPNDVDRALSALLKEWKHYA